MGGQGGREGVTRRGWGQGGPLAEKDGPGLFLHVWVRVVGRIGEGERKSGNKVWVEEGEGGAIFQEGKDTMGDLVDREVFADTTSGSLPHKGEFHRVELGQEGAVALREPKEGPRRDRLMEPASGRVDLGRGGGQPKGGHALAMFNQQWEGWEAGLNGQYGDGSGEGAVGNLSVHMPPEGVKPVLHFHEGGEEVGAVHENWGD